MTLPTLRWLRILAYGGFHDVPRRIVAMDHEFELWLFDSPFDEAADDYAAGYAIYRIGTDTMDAKRALQSPSVADALPVEARVGALPVENVEFDASHRHMLFVHDRRFVPPAR